MVDKKKMYGHSQSVGFEPTLPEGIWFLVRRLNHSATTAITIYVTLEGGEEVSMGLLLSLFLGALFVCSLTMSSSFDMHTALDWPGPDLASARVAQSVER